MTMWRPEQWNCECPVTEWHRAQMLICHVTLPTLHSASSVLGMPCGPPVLKMDDHGYLGHREQRKSEIQNESTDPKRRGCSWSESFCCLSIKSSLRRRHAWYFRELKVPPWNINQLLAACLSLWHHSAGRRPCFFGARDQALPVAVLQHERGAEWARLPCLLLLEPSLSAPLDEDVCVGPHFTSDHEW